MYFANVKSVNKQTSVQTKTFHQILPLECSALTLKIINVNNCQNKNDFQYFLTKINDRKIYFWIFMLKSFIGQTLARK